MFVAGVELASAYVSLAMSSKGLGRDVIKQFGGVEKEAGETGKRAGSQLMANFGKVAKKSAVGAGIAVGAAAGAAMVGGFKAAVGRDTSERVLTGLYGSAKDATSILGDLRKVAGNSPIDYSAYTSAAESLAYAGIEGKAAKGTLENVGKAITSAGGDSSKMEQAMGGVMKAVNNGGIVMMDSLNMISDSGVPILSGLAEQYNKPIDQVKNMASEGKIGIDDVMSVMEKGTGDTFQSMIKAGESASLSFGNQWSMAVDNISNAVGDVLLPFLKKLAPAIKPMSDALVKGIGDIPAIFQSIADAGGKVWGVLKDWAPMIGAIAGAFVAYNTVLAISNGLSMAKYLWESRSLLIGAARISITTGMATAQAALNAVMAANPIGLIVAGLVLLVGGLVMAYKKVGWFRDFIDAAWAVIKVAAKAVGDWFMNTLWPGMKAAFEGIGNAATWLYENGIKPAWDGIKTAIDVVVGWFTGTVAPGVQSTTDGIGSVFTWLYENIIKPTFAGIGTVIGFFWDGIKLYFGFVRTIITNVLVPAFEKIWEIVSFVFKLVGQIIKTVWNSLIKPIFTAIVRFIADRLVAQFNLLKNTVDFVWNMIKSAIGAVWSWLKVNVFQPIFDWILAKIVNPFNKMRVKVNRTWNLVKALLYAGWKWLKTNVFSPIMDWVQKRVVRSFTNMKNLVQGIWDGVRNLLRSGWNFIKDKIFTPLMDFITKDVPDAFEKGKDAIGKAWDMVKEVAKTPIKFVIETVINKGIIDKFRDVGSFFKMKDSDLPTHVKLPKGFDTGGYTGPGRKYQPAGVVHADEYVLRKQAQRKLSRNYGRGTLDHMNRFGTIPGYAGGGEVPGYAGGGMVWNNLWGIIKEKFPWARLTSAYRPGANTASGNSSYHASGKAVDLAGRGSMNMGDMMKIFNFIDSNYGQSSEVIHSPAGGRQIKNGRRHNYTGAVKRMHYNHVHWANDSKFGGPTASAGGSSDNSGGGISLDFLTGAFTKMKDALGGQFEKFGPAGDVVKSAASWGIERPIAWIKDNLHKVTGFVSDAWNGAKETVVSGAAKTQGRAWATANGVHGEQWKALDYIISRESGWDPKAQNPRSTAAGLPQFIAANQRHYGVYPIRQQSVWKQLDAFMKYANERYGGVTGARDYWKRNNHYDTGGMVSPTLFDKGGVLQPGTQLVSNKTRKPEYILPSRVTDALMGGNVGTAGGEEHFHFHGPDPDAAMRSYESTRRRRELLEVR